MQNSKAISKVSAMPSNIPGMPALKHRFFFIARGAHFRRSQTVHGGGHAGRRLVEGEELKIQQSTVELN